MPCAMVEPHCMHACMRLAGMHCTLARLRECMHAWPHACRAEGAREYRETLGLEISERAFTDQPEGIPVSIAGESCIPGIDTENLAAIFEEHVVVSSLDPFNPGNNEFATRERIFSFGAVLAALSGDPEVRLRVHAHRGCSVIGFMRCKLPACCRCQACGGNAVDAAVCDGWHHMGMLVCTKRHAHVEVLRARQGSD